MVEVQQLKDAAMRYRDLASRASDERMLRALQELAEECEAKCIADAPPEMS